MSNKKILVIPAILVTTLVLAGCNTNAPTENTDTQNTDTETENQINVNEGETTVPEETENEETTEESSEEVVVTYTDTGYEPAEVAVDAGTTVTFVNESTGEMWTASDVHPTHEVLSEFDQRSTGDEYSYTFDQAGEWDFHNHVAPSHVGTVTVTE